MTENKGKFANVACKSSLAIKCKQPSFSAFITFWKKYVVFPGLPLPRCLARAKLGLITYHAFSRLRQLVGGIAKIFAFSHYLFYQSSLTFSSVRWSVNDGRHLL